MAASCEEIESSSSCLRRGMSASVLALGSPAVTGPFPEAVSDASPLFNVGAFHHCATRNAKGAPFYVCSLPLTYQAETVAGSEALCAAHRNREAGSPSNR
jgi:hypothetical protein